MLEFKRFRITTDGEKFRIEGLITPINDNERWIPISKEGFYWGCESFGFENIGEKLFNTKQEAIEFIKTEWGNEGVRKIVKEWIPC